MRPVEFAILALITAPLVESSALAQDSQSLVAAILDIRYDVTFDSATAIKRSIDVAMSFTTRGAGDVLLSLPAWTPGEYEIQNFARYVTQFAATEGPAPAKWDKVDQDTWRIHATRAGQIRVSFEYLAMMVFIVTFVLASHNFKQRII